MKNKFSVQTQGSFDHYSKVATPQELARLTAPRSKIYDILYLLAFIAVGAIATGCEMTPGEQAAMGTALGNDVNVSTTQPPIGQLEPQCFNERFIQPDAEIVKKIDLLFVTDTSGSLSTERAAIAQGIDSFVAQIPSDVDYRVAVMLSHSSRSSWAGKLYKKSTEPVVLNSTTMSLADIRTALHSKLYSPSSDYWADGGEEAFYSLHTGLQATAFQAAQAQGFFRQDAALVVVFVSDEQEICYDYKAGEVAVPDADRYNGSTLESLAKTRDCSFRDYQGNTRKIDQELILSELRGIQGSRPLLVSAIVYNNETSYVKDGENELAHGYLDLISSAHGLSIDMAGSHFDQGLSDIGRLATIRLHTVQEFTLARTNVDESSIESQVDGSSAQYTYHSDRNEVHLDDAGGARSVVDIRYCLNATSDGSNTGGTTSGGSTSGGTGGGVTPTPTPTPILPCGGTGCNVIGI